MVLMISRWFAVSVRSSCTTAHAAPSTNPAPWSLIRIAPSAWNPEGTRTDKATTPPNPMWYDAKLMRVSQIAQHSHSTARTPRPHVVIE